MGTRTALGFIVASLIVAGCGGSSPKAATVQPGDPAKVDRTIDIHLSDDLKFDPAAVSVKRGETVAFQVVNPSKVQHEFVVGDSAFQKAHENEMKTMPADMAMPDEATSLDLPAGQSKTINLTFPTSGTLVYGCHEPGHYAAGMKGAITVT